MFPPGPSHRMGWGLQRGIHSFPVPLNPLWLGGTGAPGDTWGDGELFLCPWGKEVRGHKLFQGCLQLLGASQQHLKPNELSPTAPQLSKLCRGFGCPIRFPLMQAGFRCPWCIAKPGTKTRRGSPSVFVGRGAREGCGSRDRGRRLWVQIFR